MEETTLIPETLEPATLNQAVALGIVIGAALVPAGYLAGRALGRGVVKLAAWMKSRQASTEETPIVA